MGAYGIMALTGLYLERPPLYVVDFRAVLEGACGNYKSATRGAYACYKNTWFPPSFIVFICFRRFSSGAGEAAALKNA